DPDRRGLACPVGTEEPEHRAFFDGQAEPVERPHVRSERLDEAVRLDRIAVGIAHVRRVTPNFELLNVIIVTWVYVNRRSGKPVNRSPTLPPRCSLPTVSRTSPCRTWPGPPRCPSRPSTTTSRPRSTWSSTGPRSWRRPWWNR